LKSAALKFPDLAKDHKISDNSSFLNFEC